jgi:hypothetical protein
MELVHNVMQIVYNAMLQDHVPHMFVIINQIATVLQMQILVMPVQAPSSMMQELELVPVVPIQIANNVVLPQEHVMIVQWDGIYKLMHVSPAYKTALVVTMVHHVLCVIKDIHGLLMPVFNVIQLVISVLEQLSPFVILLNALQMLN